jgi:hypothetical protein
MLGVQHVGTAVDSFGGPQIMNMKINRMLPFIIQMEARL